MAIDANIVNFGQSTPTADALGRFGGAVAGAITANKQAGLSENRRKAAGFLAQAFSDDSDDAQTKALIEQAQALDPEFTLATMQQVRGGKSRSGLESRRLDLLELNAQTAADKEFRLSTGAGPQIPEELLGGLSPEVAEKVSATFTAAGGGDKGVKAVAKVIDKATEQERRLASPEIIKASFPNATTEEVDQLQSTMDAAKTTEAGLKAATLVRERQRSTKKGDGFRVRGISLIKSILANPQLGDVLGSIEGAIDFRLSDSESELIDDITEVGDILTADNLNLMSGVLSESDIKILRSLAGGGLKRTRTEERFIKDVTEILTRLGGSLDAADNKVIDNDSGGDVKKVVQWSDY